MPKVSKCHGCSHQIIGNGNVTCDAGIALWNEKCQLSDSTYEPTVTIIGLRQETLNLLNVFRTEGQDYDEVILNLLHRTE